jgi:hypothetical protein
VTAASIVYAATSIGAIRPQGAEFFGDQSL